MFLSKLNVFAGIVLILAQKLAISLATAIVVSVIAAIFGGIVDLALSVGGLHTNLATLGAIVAFVTHIYKETK